MERYIVTKDNNGWKILDMVEEEKIFQSDYYEGYERTYAGLMAVLDTLDKRIERLEDDLTEMRRTLT